MNENCERGGGQRELTRTEYSWNGGRWAPDGEGGSGGTMPTPHHLPCRYCGKAAENGLGFHLDCMEDADSKKKCKGDRAYHSWSSHKNVTLPETPCLCSHTYLDHKCSSRRCMVTGCYCCRYRNAQRSDARRTPKEGEKGCRICGTRLFSRSRGDVHVTCLKYEKRQKNASKKTARVNLLAVPSVTNNGGHPRAFAG